MDGKKIGNGKKFRKIFDVIRKPRKPKAQKPIVKKVRLGRSIKRPKNLKNISSVNGFFHITVLKSATSHTEWLENARAHGIKVHAYSKYDFLPCIDFGFEEKEFELVIMKIDQLDEKNHSIDKTIDKITSYAVNAGYRIPEPEMGCFILDAITPDILDVIGVKSIQIGHVPISWKDALLLKSKEEADNAHPKYIESSIQFVVGYDAYRRLEIHTDIYSTERNIAKTRGIAFLAPKK